MKPPPFAYHRPRSRDDVDGLLAELGAEAKLLAGGQSLIPILNMRLAAPAHIVDLNFLAGEPAEPELRDGALAFGPLVRLAAAETSPLVAERLPLLRQALRHVAHPAIRSRGTLVGSIAHADPAAELPAVMVLVDGEAAVRSTRGRRTVPARELFAGALECALEPGEWIEEVRLPARSGGAFTEFARRHGDYALCGVAALPDAVAFVGMGPVPRRLPLDRPLADVIGALDPPDDIHASAGYRRWLAERLAARALEAA